MFVTLQDMLTAGFARMKLHRNLPAWLWIAGITLGRHVFVKALTTQNTVNHESVHVAQQERDGTIRFYLRYLFSGFWRARYEAEACVNELRSGVSLEALAKTISSSLYLWPCSYDKALMHLRAAQERM